MCGRYALGVRLAFIRQRLQDQGLPVDEAPDDDAVRETYNFAPGSFGAVYRADIPEHGHAHHHQPGVEESEAQPADAAPQDNDDSGSKTIQPTEKADTKYKLQSMKWGLVPFWTKRQPDYGSLMRTINCRDDSLHEDRGMWTSMKRRKRCIVICQGFYEWLKKGPGGKEKVPHFVRRKDGDLMCFAGLWDCVSYEGSEERLYTYTVITTSPNSYLKFLHDRMPVILDPGSDAMKTWLDPSRTTWSKELQFILKPYEGELECYPVPKEVGKVGNNSPDFIVPVNSKENKSNIANFFANAKKKGTLPSPKKQIATKTVKDENKEHTTLDSESTEHHSPAPAVKRELTPDTQDLAEKNKKQKVDTAASSPQKTGTKMRSATHNTPRKNVEKKPADGSQRITNFFKK